MAVPLADSGIQHSLVLRTRCDQLNNGLCAPSGSDRSTGTLDASEGLSPQVGC